MLTYLIDDDAVSLFLTEQMLRLEGFTDPILSFNDSEKALHHLSMRPETELPRLILLDLNMPVLDGWAFLDALAAQEPLVKSRCLIYLLTSSLALADTYKAQRYPLVAGIIHKPLDEDEVGSILLRSKVLASPSWNESTTGFRR